MKRILILTAALLAIAGKPAEQDADFDAHVENPAYQQAGPRVCIDEAHRNHHTLDGRYAPLARLLENDGYRLMANQGAFEPEALGRCDVLVIANAKGVEDEADSAFTAEEIAAVHKWVAGGGSLLLIADHAPFGLAATDLSAAFGIQMAGLYLKDETHSQPDLPGPYFLRFESAQGMIGDHPITQGRNDSDEIAVVLTFGGQALDDPKRLATPLLLLSEDAMIVSKPGVEDAEEWSAAGMSHALALELEKGRVVVVGEAGLFSAQVIRGETAEKMGLEEFRFGMTRDDTDDRQFVLNVFHWLSGLL